MSASIETVSHASPERLDDVTEDVTQGAPARKALDPSVRALARLAVGAVLERKAEDVVVLDVTGRTSYCDVFVLCTGTQARHVRAIADSIVQSMRDERGDRPMGVEGKETARWVLVDLGDVVVHIFDGPMRGYYDLDGLWMDARRVSFEELGLSEEGEDLEAAEE